MRTTISWTALACPWALTPGCAGSIAGEPDEQRETPAPGGTTTTPGPGGSSPPPSPAPGATQACGQIGAAPMRRLTRNE